MVKPFVLVMLMWAVFWLDYRFMLDLYRFGILPRHIEGLVGIGASPLLHGSLLHITNNTLPLLALGAGLFFFYPRIAVVVIAVSWFGSGLVVWVIGRESYHIGASGLIYALAGFIFLSGLLRKQTNLLALSLLVVFLYGGLVWGVFPIKENVSWEAHLAGASSGFALAIHFRNFGPRRKLYSWELEDTLNDELKEEDLNFTRPPERKPEEREAWEDYSHSAHGIRYIYKGKGSETEDKSHS